jgi:hypothetical protein
MISCGFSSNQSIDCYSSHPQQKHIEHDRTIIYYGFVYCFRLRCFFFSFFFVSSHITMLPVALPSSLTHAWPRFAQLPFAIPKLRRFLGAPYVPMKRKAVEAPICFSAVGEFRWIQAPKKDSRWASGNQTCLAGKSSINMCCITDLWLGYSNCNVWLPDGNYM